MSQSAMCYFTAEHHDRSALGIGVSRSLPTGHNNIGSKPCDSCARGPAVGQLNLFFVWLQVLIKRE